ncbi:MAG: helix-turn-helix domain-containing protein [Alphaproteobacteria bacterium]|nr:helix-turn-helix domain-containing protein [Alphaproteobacteria bacterium]
MQQKESTRRSNRDRSEETRGKLLKAARTLFVEKGYAETGTPEIVKAAAVTRGALYHHFADKADLFRAVVVQEATAVAGEIESAALDLSDPIEALVTGAEAYFRAMRAAGRARILLIDGPAVLGADALAEIDRETGGGTLHAGLAHAAQRHGRSDLPLEELAQLLSAAFDRAALAVSEGADPTVYATAMRELLTGLFR